jgi:hypothetical protein
VILGSLSFFSPFLFIALFLFLRVAARFADRFFSIALTMKIGEVFFGMAARAKFRNWRAPVGFQNLTPRFVESSAC